MSTVLSCVARICGEKANISAMQSLHSNLFGIISLIQRVMS